MCSFDRYRPCRHCTGHCTSHCLRRRRCSVRWGSQGSQWCFPTRRASQLRTAPHSWPMSARAGCRPCRHCTVRGMTTNSPCCGRRTARAGTTYTAYCRRCSTARNCSPQQRHLHSTARRVRYVRAARAQYTTGTRQFSSSACRASRIAHRVAMLYHVHTHLSHMACGCHR
jgi:hypothetical protein